MQEYMYMVMHGSYLRADTLLNCNIEKVRTLVKDLRNNHLDFPGIYSSYLPTARLRVRE